MNRDVPIPRAPQPDNFPMPQFPSRPSEEVYGGPARRYTPAEWASMVFGRDLRKKRRKQ